MHIIAAYTSPNYTVHSFSHQNVGATLAGLRRVDEGFLTSHTSKHTRHTGFVAQARQDKYTENRRENDYLLLFVSRKEKAGSVPLHNSHRASWRGIPFAFLSTDKTQNDKHLRNKT